VNAPTIRPDLLRPRPLLVGGGSVTAVAARKASKTPRASKVPEKRAAAKKAQKPRSGPTEASPEPPRPREDCRATQLRHELSFIINSVQNEIPGSPTPRFYALALSLLRAADLALGAEIDEKSTSSLLRELTRCLGEKLVSYPFDKQTEADRIGKVVALQLNLVPCPAENNDLRDSDRHRRGVSDFVAMAMVNRLRVSTWWAQHLPVGWDSETVQLEAQGAVAVVLARLDHSVWVKNTDKVVRAYLRAVGVDENLFKNVDFYRQK
jgi:hypothetical protein